MELSSLAGVMVTDDNSVLPDTPRVGTGCGVAQLLGKGVGNSCGSYHFVKTPRCFRMLKKGRWVLVASRQWLRSASTLRLGPISTPGGRWPPKKGVIGGEGMPFIVREWKEGVQYKGRRRAKVCHLE